MYINRITIYCLRQVSEPGESTTELISLGVGHTESNHDDTQELISLGMTQKNCNTCEDRGRDIEPTHSEHTLSSDENPEQFIDDNRYGQVNSIHTRTYIYGCVHSAVYFVQWHIKIYIR